MLGKAFCLFIGFIIGTFFGRFILQKIVDIILASI